MELSKQIRELESSINDLLPKVAVLETAITKAVEKWNT